MSNQFLYMFSCGFILIVNEFCGLYVCLCEANDNFIFLVGCNQESCFQYFLGGQYEKLMNKTVYQNVLVLADDRKEQRALSSLCPVAFGASTARYTRNVKKTETVREFYNRRMGETK